MLSSTTGGTATTSSTTAAGFPPGFCSPGGAAAAPNIVDGFSIECTTDWCCCSKNCHRDRFDLLGLLVASDFSIISFQIIISLFSILTKAMISYESQIYLVSTADWYIHTFPLKLCGDFTNPSACTLV